MPQYINPLGVPANRSKLTALGLTERRVLHEIRREERIHRMEIAARCDLQPSTLTRAAGELLALGLITEVTETNPGRRGKPRQYLSVNPQGAYAIGVGLTAEEMMVCLADFSGQVLWRRSEPLTRLDPSAIVEQASDAVRACLSETGLTSDQILGVGVTMPGGASIHPPYYFKPLPQFVGWDQVSPRKLFLESLGLPAWVQNDAHGTAVAEAQFGAARRRSSFMTIYIAHGFGAGLVCNGQIFTGANGNAGAIGGLLPRPMARPSGDDLLRTLASAGFRFDRLHDVDWNGAAAETVERWSVRAAGQLADVVRMASLIVDPECVVLTGLLPQAVLTRLAEGIRNADYLGSHDLPGPVILVSPLVDSGIQLGAAALAFMDTFTPQSSIGAVD